MVVWGETGSVGTDAFVRPFERSSNALFGPAQGQSMEQRLSLITLGVTDLNRSRNFYERSDSAAPWQKW